MCSPRPHLEPGGGDPGRRPRFLIPRNLLAPGLALVLLLLLLLPLGSPPDAAGRGAFSGTLPLNPAVAALVDSVSENRLRLSVERLAGFFTRNTVSDTASPTTGIGAARRWTRDQYAAYGAANGGNLAAGYFDFIANICSITGAYRNVIAQQNGSRYPNRFFMVSGHLDGRTVGLCDVTSFAPAANDDASGTAVTLEMAYLIGKLNIESSMLFMATVGEDQGLFGGQAYADFAAANGMDIAGMATDDIVGNIRNELNETDSTRVRHFSGGLATSNSRQLARYFKLKGEAYQPGFTVDLIPAIDRPGRSGDHVPFHNKGYAAVRFIETIENLSQQHTDQDLPQFMSFPYLTRIARVNLAGFASLLLAPKPPTGLEVRDVGNGTDVRVTWNPNSENDLAGYRVAFRFDTGDSLFYQDIFDAGLATQYTMTGLNPNILIQVSVSAYDNTWNESVFCQEAPVTPRSVPLPPANFQTTSFASRVDLDWSPNLELDLQSYGVYRSSSPNSGFQLMQFIPAPATHFEDLTVPPATTLYYRLTARDNQGFESPQTITRKGRRVDHAQPALIVDATPDGAGGQTPPDARVDGFYAAMMANIPTSGEWDRADSVAVGNLLSDADLGAHRLVLYHTDSRNSVVREDTTVLRKYLQQGGKLILSGSNPAFTFGGSLNLINSLWVPGQFLHDVLKANELRTENSLDLIGVDPQIAGYPVMNVDAQKAFLGRLANQDAYIGALVGGAATEVVYHYRSLLGPAGQNHGKPDAIRVLTGGTKMVAFNVPLYFLDSLAVRTTIAQALTDLGESTLGILGAEAPPPAPTLGPAHPNPFNPATTIPFSIGTRGEVLMRIFDVQGRVVRTLVKDTLTPGAHTAVWDGLRPDGRPVGSGVYFVDLTAAKQTLRQKLVLLR